MSSEEEVSQQNIGSSRFKMPETLQKGREQRRPKRNPRRMALTSEEIEAMKQLAKSTPQKKRTKLQTQEDSQARTRTLEIPRKGSIEGITIITPKIEEQEWTRNKIL